MFQSNGAGRSRLQSRIVAMTLIALGLIGPVMSAPAHAANQAPAISGTPASWAYVGSAYAFHPIASDADGQALRFTIANKPSWASFSAATGRLAGTPVTVGLWTNIQIKVSDGVTTRALTSFSIRATQRDNSAPVLSGSPAARALVGALYLFQPSASDGEGDPLRFSIVNRPAWASFDSLTGRLSGTPTAANIGSYANIVITATDGTKKASTAAFSIAVASSANRAPTLGGTPAVSVVAGKAYSFRPIAADADNDMLGYSIRNRPTWATFSSATGQLSGTPTTTQMGTSSNIIVSVSDGKASVALPAFAIVVTAPPNKAPTISGTPVLSVNSGSAYTFRPAAVDADGDTLTFSIANRPAWAAFNAATGQLSGTPTATSVGTHSNIVISVSDGKTSAALATFAITVSDASRGTAMLTWEPPTQNTDGTALTNLAGYRIVYGTSAARLTQTLQIGNAGLSAYVVDNLTPGTYYFAVRAYTSKGIESSDSNVVSRVVQ
jgi:Putative Ig domain